MSDKKDNVIDFAKAVKGRRPAASETCACGHNAGVLSIELPSHIDPTTFTLVEASGRCKECGAMFLWKKRAPPGA